MTIRTWTLGRVVAVWAVWLAVLFLCFLALVVLNPAGLRVTLSPTGLTGGLRWAVAVAALLVLLAPPLVATYLWYLARVRDWGEGTPSSDRQREPAG